MALVDLVRDPTRRQLRQFGGLWLPAALVVVALLLRRAGHGWGLPGSLLGFAALSEALAWARPSALRLPFVGLQIAAYPFGFVVSHVLMLVIYFGVVTPVGLLLRLFKGDPLERRLDPKATTYWTPRGKPAPIERYFRPY